MKEKGSELKEIQNIFLELGATEGELKTWMERIALDRKKTEGCMVDLMLCTFVKKGLNPQHIRKLSRVMRHNRFRAIHLLDRVSYIQKYIVGSE